MSCVSIFLRFFYFFAAFCSFAGFLFTFVALSIDWLEDSMKSFLYDPLSSFTVCRSSNPPFWFSFPLSVCQ